MSWPDVAALWVAFGWVGAAVLLLIQCLLLWAVGWWGDVLFKNMRRLYHLHLIVFWLKRLERHGHKGLRVGPMPGDDV